MQRTPILTILALCLSLPVDAATIELTVIGNAPGGQFRDAIMENALEGSVSGRVSGPGLFGSGVASGSASADLVTGELRYQVDADVVPSVPCGVGASICAPSALSLAQISIRESFLVTGTGTLTAGLQYDGFLSATSYFHLGNVFLTGGTSSDLNFYSVDDFTNPAPQGQFSETLFSQVEVRNAVDRPMTVSWQMQGQVNEQNGLAVEGVRSFIDASNTGLMFLQMTGSLAVAGLAEGFLSDPTYGRAVAPPIPLPASFWLLGAGLLGLGFFRRTNVEASRPAA